MENEDLKDILLDKGDENKSKRVKKMLIFAAVLVNIFLIVIVAMKILNTGDSTVAQNEVDSRLVLPPAPAQQQPAVQTPPPVTQTPPPVAAQKDDKLFEQVPIGTPENKPKDEFEDMVKKLKEKESAKTAPSESKTVAVEAKAPTTQTQPKAEQKTEAKPEAESKPAVQDEPKKVANLESNTETKSQKDKPSKKTSAKPAQQTASKAASGAYVQVSAVSNFNPNHELIKKIKANGYEYQTAKVGEMTKVLVGPYEGAQLQKVLADIRKNVNKNAFIYRAK